eukprot:TRINITY_DN621_c0_g7_i1.p1 TRINITY_DN621_c0_g7~~TRINITY_DN621_c0_g7_i1.p1  ORF type:complete len:174 (-),score=15.63 TRINITY_DN621_c0_g7_i1:111-632(-)
MAFGDVPLSDEPQFLDEQLLDEPLSGAWGGAVWAAEWAWAVARVAAWGISGAAAHVGALGRECAVWAFTWAQDYSWDSLPHDLWALRASLLLVAYAIFTACLCLRIHRALSALARSLLRALCALVFFLAPLAALLALGARALLPALLDTFRDPTHSVPLSDFIHAAAANNPLR